MFRLPNTLQVLAALLVSVSFSYGQTDQGAVSQTLHPSELTKHCGSYDLLEHTDHEHPGYLEHSNAFIQELGQQTAATVSRHRTGEILRVPVVFHVVYSDSTQNLPDSVIYSQLDVLNECFRRTNADAANTRPEFLNLVGDTEIEFVLADEDPDGFPTSGITRTNTTVSHFGGVLPYGPAQTTEIQQWVQDSLLDNMFSLTHDSLGGINAWDEDRYINVWIGDLRIFEPQFNNFEELVYFGLATPPQDHPNWPDSLQDDLEVHGQVVLMHYVNVGANNPNNFPAPYNVYNGLTTTGKMLVHEVGHHLGLRHIWGDGDCTMDDFIADTPNSPAASGYNCNLNANSCTDDIDGVDLPNMVENYMDYSSADCQNSFTIGQLELMREVLYTYRPGMILGPPTSINESWSTEPELVLYPNPTAGQVFIDLQHDHKNVQATVLDQLGRVRSVKRFTSANLIQLDLDGPSGLYMVRLQVEGEEDQLLKVLRH